MPRFFVPFDLEIHQDYRLPESVLHHLNVRRLKVDEVITLFNGDGRSYHAKITVLAKREASVHIFEISLPENESPLSICLAQGIASKDRMDFVLQKCVELGVNAFQPLVTERSQGTLSEERELKRLKRWQEIVISACEQCGRNVIPTVLPVKTLSEFLTHLPPQEAYWVLSIAKNNGLKNVSEVPKQVCLLAGPEGGLSSQEEELAFANHFKPMTLGPRILRTETAAMSAVAAMQALWGDF